MKSSEEFLHVALKQTSDQFKSSYSWLEHSMPAPFFARFSEEDLILITQSLMHLDHHNFFSIIHTKYASIILCLDNPDADLQILSHFSNHLIKSYQTFTSSNSVAFQGVNTPLKVVRVEHIRQCDYPTAPLSSAGIEHISEEIKKGISPVSTGDIERLVQKISTRFIDSLSNFQLSSAIENLKLAETCDDCIYTIHFHKDLADSNYGKMTIIFAWRNTPLYGFLSHLARIIYQYGFIIKSADAQPIDPLGVNDILVMNLCLYTQDQRPTWENPSVPEFLKELFTFKYFHQTDMIEEWLVSKNILNGNMANLLRALIPFIYQVLVHLDPNLYRIENIEETFCRHPDLTLQWCHCFALKFDPATHDKQAFEIKRQKFIIEVEKLDTGQEENDARRKNVLVQAMNFLTHTLKTNFYRKTYTALSFRLDPNYLDFLPYERSKKFPILPYGIFYIKGWRFFGYHIRFKDLARGGLRTVIPENEEIAATEKKNVFTECYHLALTQQKKNKDIPEGGAKGVIFIEPSLPIQKELVFLENSLESSQIDPEKKTQSLNDYAKAQKVKSLYLAQRTFTEGLMTLINADTDGTLKADNVVDYWKKPEYLYLGPDENMHNSMIEWIANFSHEQKYKPGTSFITSKPQGGINHKEYGVTSLGVNVYMEACLKFIGIDPYITPFTIKMTGGPDGDVAGNQLLNLYHFYPTTAKLIELTDGSGSIYDPQGLDLAVVANLFLASEPIRHYPPEKLSEGGFLIDRMTKRNLSEYVQEILCWRKINHTLQENWLSSSEANHLLRHHLHKTAVDVFIPAGGRPKTLNETNIQDYLTAEGHPSSKIIVEGANLYLTPEARQYVEQKGVIVIKDSSANKGGVICSSFEVLCGLTLSDEDFLINKNQLVQEVLERIKQCAYNEADLLLRTYKETGERLTILSEKISERINFYKYELLDFLEGVDLSLPSHFSLIEQFLDYCLPTLKDHFKKDLLLEIPDNHKKAIIACSLATQAVYSKGVYLNTSIMEFFPHQKPI